MKIDENHEIIVFAILFMPKKERLEEKSQ